MPIFDQGYQHWNGQLAGHTWRWLAIADQGVRAQLRKKGTKWLIASGFAPALALAGALIGWGLLEQKSTLLDSVQWLIQGLPPEIRSGPKAYRTSYWTMAFHTFFTLQVYFAMVVVLWIGPDLISQDLRFNAMPLYFSRPLRRIDYFLGKLGVIAFFLSMVAILPALLAYLLGVSFSFELAVFRDTGRLFFAILGFGAVIVLSAGTFMLAVSSLSRDSRAVGAAWLVLWMISAITSKTLVETVNKDWCPIVSYTRNLCRVQEQILGTPAARDQFLDLIDASRRAAAEAAEMAQPFARLRHSLMKPPPLPPPPEKREVPGLLTLETDRFPLSWSAGVLAGLFGMAVWTLTTRVKSLDRLK